jgi:ketosteroid isomerase-like protein
MAGRFRTAERSDLAAAGTIPSRNCSDFVLGFIRSLLGDGTMSEQSDNVSILKRAYETWASKKAADIDCWASIIADEARLKSLADGAPAVTFTRQRIGKSEIISYLEDLTKDWQMIFYRIDEYVAERDRVVAIGSTSWKNKLTSKVMTTPKVDIWRMRDGKVVEFSEFYDTANILAAAQP